MKPTYKQRVRVIDSTLGPTSVTRSMVGKEYELQISDHDTEEYKVNDHWFNKSDLQFLTPVEFKGKAIAIGDEVKWGGSWYMVYDYYWFDGKWNLLVVKDNDYENKCYGLRADKIFALRSPNQDDATEEAIKLLKDKGYKIVKE